MNNYKLILLLFFFGFITVSSNANGEDEWIRAGHEKLMQRDFEKAIFFFSRSIEEYPNQVEAYLKRAKAYLIINKYQEAHEDYQKALSIDPNFIKDRKGQRTQVSDSLKQTTPMELFIN